MPYEFDEIKLTSDEGRDWWETIKKVPLKILDQDFGIEVPLSDLVESSADDENPENEEEGTPSSTTKDKDVTLKVLDLDNFKRKSALLKESGYSKVVFDKEYFEAKIFSRQFDKNDFSARIEKGFLIVSGCRKEKVEGDGLVWRKLDRRYMLPHDCIISDVKHQMKIESIEGGIVVRVFKVSQKKSSLMKTPSPQRSPTTQQLSPKSANIRAKDKENKLPPTQTP